MSFAAADAEVSVGQEPIEITGDVEIRGSGEDGTRISAWYSNLFAVTETGVASFRNLILADMETHYIGAPCGLGVGNEGVALLENVIIEENSSRYGGVGLCNGGTMTIRDSVVRGNYALFHGSGGGFQNYGEATVERTAFTDNYAILGGAAISNSGTMTVRDSTFSENTAPGAAGGGDGGAIFNAGELTIEMSVISDNHASDSFNETGGSGGGIHNDGMLVVRDSTISDNTADHAGGMFNAGEATIERSTISGNEAGAVLNQSDSLLTISNSTVSSNRAGEFPDSGTGGISNFGTLRLRDSTVANNTGTHQTSGGVNNTAAVQVRNTIFSNNGDQGCTPGQLWLPMGGNVADDSSCVLGGGDIFVRTRGYMPLGDYGGPTEVHALEAGQSRDGRRDARLCPAPDQRGANRPVNGVCDAGSYEFGGVVPSPTGYVRTNDATRIPDGRRQLQRPHRSRRHHRGAASGGGDFRALVLRPRRSLRRLRRGVLPGVDRRRLQRPRSSRWMRC